MAQGELNSEGRLFLASEELTAFRRQVGPLAAGSAEEELSSSLCVTG